MRWEHASAMPTIMRRSFNRGYPVWRGTGRRGCHLLLLTLCAACPKKGWEQCWIPSTCFLTKRLKWILRPRLLQQPVLETLRITGNSVNSSKVRPLPRARTDPASSGVQTPTGLGWVLRTGDATHQIRRGRECPKVRPMTKRQIARRCSAFVRAVR